MTVSETVGAWTSALVIAVGGVMLCIVMITLTVGLILWISHAVITAYGKLYGKRPSGSTRTR